jgi:hypothetical protein
LCVAFAAWLAALVVAGRAWGLAPATAQAVATLIALAQCATPLYAETLVRAAPAGTLRYWALDGVTGANPLLVTARSILDWDIWHNPYLYGFTDVAGYGSTHTHWAGASAVYLVGAAGAAGIAWWGARRRGYLTAAALTASE